MNMMIYRGSTEDFCPINTQLISFQAWAGK